MKTKPDPRPRFASLREFVYSFPRSVRMYEIAALLGVNQGQLSHYLAGRRPGTRTALRLHRDHGIDLAGLLDPPPPPPAVDPQDPPGGAAA